MLKNHRFSPHKFREATIHEYPKMDIGEHLLDIYERLGFYSETDPPETVFNEIFLELVTFVLDDYDDMGRNSSRLISRLDAVAEISTLLATYYPSAWLEKGTQHTFSRSPFRGNSLASIFTHGSERLPTQSYSTEHAEWAVELYIAHGLQSRAFELFLIDVCIFIPGISYAQTLAEGLRPAFNGEPPIASFVHQRFAKKLVDGFIKLKLPSVPTSTQLVAWITGLIAAYIGFEQLGATGNVIQAVLGGIALMLLSWAITLGPVGINNTIERVKLSEWASNTEDDARHLIQFYEKARVTSPVQTLQRLNHLNTRGFYFPAALENLLEYMMEQQTIDRHSSASYLLHGTKIRGDSDT